MLTFKWPENHDLGQPVRSDILATAGLLVHTEQECLVAHSGVEV